MYTDSVYITTEFKTRSKNTNPYTDIHAHIDNIETKKQKFKHVGRGSYTDCHAHFDRIEGEKQKCKHVYRHSCTYRQN